MSRSFETCLELAKNPERSTFAQSDFTKAIELDAKTTFANVFDCKPDEFKTLEASITKDGKGMTLFISLDFNPDMDCEFFASSRCLSDGTMLFQQECIYKLMQKIAFVQTYDKRLHEPQDGDRIKYTVGNIVLNIEHGDFGTDEKPWLRERVTALLPLKMEYL